MTPLEINKKIAEAKFGDDFIYYESGYVESFTLCRPYNWAENISDAWELFEEMPLSTKLEQCNSGVAKFWCCSYEEYIPEFSGEDATAPLAIAKAWLAWKESKR